MEDRLTLRARWVAPVDRPPIHDGQLVVEQGRVANVARRQACDGPVQDLGDVVLMPGLVNAHTHLEFSDLTRPLGQPGISLSAWIRQIIGERHRSDRRAEPSIAAGLSDSLLCGVTALGEIATGDVSRYASSRRPRLTLFQEAIGFSAGRVESVAADVLRRLEATPGDLNSAIVGISPHAPYTVHPELLQRLVDVAVARDLPLAMHLAESQEELQLLADGTGPLRQLLEDRSMWDPDAIPRRTSVLDYLQTLARAPRALVIHGNYLTTDEIALLGRQRATMSVVYCPRTHAYFQHAAYPLPQLLAGGARVALGTDSRASSPDLNLLAEMRAVASRFSAIAPEEIVRMATIEGAVALGLDRLLGSLAPGKFADLAAISCDPASSDPYEAVVAPDSTVRGVWLRGQPIS